MNLTERINSFAAVGEIIRNCLDGKTGRFESILSGLVDKQQKNNPWFTPDNVRLSLLSVAEMLAYDRLASWTSSYPDLQDNSEPMNVGVIMAGNIPLVGFHDFLCVLITGNNILAKTSSKDRELIKFVAGMLCAENNGFSDKIKFSEGPLTGFDAVIATGSDNSARYFEYYFGKYPGIIRKNRNSVAVLTGQESNAEIAKLAKDIFSYFGLGCRNVSKIYIPDGYDTDLLLKNWEHYSGIINHTKYANNYEYNKAICLINREHFRDGGFVLLKEDTGLSSPVSVLNYEYYKSTETVNDNLETGSERIQCIVGPGNIPFGMSQMPELWDYADKIDTVDFLLKKNHGRIF